MACHNQPSGIHRPASLRLADWGCIRERAFSFLSFEESEELEIPTDSSVETMKFFSVIRVPLACDVFLTRCSFVTLPASIFPSSFVDASRVSILLRLFVATALQHLHCATILLPRRASSFRLASSGCAAFEGVDILCLWSHPCGLILSSSRNITAHRESTLEAPQPFFPFMSFDSHQPSNLRSCFLQFFRQLRHLHPPLLSPSSAESTLLASHPPPTADSISEYQALSLGTCSDFAERLSANSFSFRRFGEWVLFGLEGWVCVGAANGQNGGRAEEWHRDIDERRSEISEEMD
ncbi:hypothetical protein V8E51_005151 [Hyaloscypha variabilis]